ncbi:tyrosine-type recombinase/integrase [Jannaschia sp. 2305UL9-9]|uniref:tyrosine-type recombinase/integrase n=1 Tax=Jannaschia sp. 2305UL9-9 TaxID=3121638 RepID=UPI0035294EF5
MPRYLLSVKKVQALKEPGRYADGGGLYHHVGKGDAKSWIMRIMQRGKRHDLGLGSAHFVTLAEAREMAAEIQAQARAGESVETFIRKRRDANASVKTVEQAARLHFAEASKNLSKRTRDLWESRLNEDVLPVIGHMPIHEVTSRDIKKVLSPIWFKKPDTAHRVRSRLSQLFKWASVEGHYPHNNPVEGVEEVLGDNSRDTKHHAALPWKELPAFMTDVATRDGTSARCLEWLILNACRSIEARGAKWDEIDWNRKVWTIPAERMKGKVDRRKEHRVPLSEEALAVLEKVKGLDTELIFPNPRGKILSDMAFKSIFKRMERDNITAHGFRSCFQDWTDDNGVADTMLADKALAYVEKNQVRKAYARSDLFERRRELMDTWGRFSTSKNWIPN